MEKDREERFQQTAARIREELAVLGQPALLEKGGQTYRFSALAVPAASEKNTEYTPIGEVPGNRYTYYGPFDGGGELLEGRDIITIGLRRYLVEAVGDYFLGETAVYRTAALRLIPPREEEQP